MLKELVKEIAAAIQPCTVCMGKGGIHQEARIGEQVWRKCASCNGKGEAPSGDLRELMVLLSRVGL